MPLPRREARRARAVTGALRASLTGAAVLSLVGCGGPDEGQVVAAARAFSSALQARDGTAACELLALSTREELERSQGQRCGQALAAQDLEPLVRIGRVERYGHQASVVVEARSGRPDTWFLTRFDDRWLVVAARCEPRPELPYACDVEGP